MSELEERLRDALSARAELVQAEDLAPAAPPRAEPARPPWRRPVWYVSVAAAVVLVVAGPLLVRGLIRADDGSAPPVTRPTASQGTSGWWETPAGLPTKYSGVAGQPSVSENVDADADEESVHFLGIDGGGYHLEVRDQGRTTSVRIDGRTPLVEGAPSLPGADGPVIVVSTLPDDLGRDTAWRFRAFTYADGDLVALPVVGTPRLIGKTTAGDKPGPITTWVRGDRLYTMEFTGEPSTGTRPGHTGDLTVQPVRVYEWSVEEGALRSTSLGEGCVTRLPDDQVLHGCPEQ